MFTTRECDLLIACVDAELANNAQLDTPLSLSVTEDNDDPDQARETLRGELRVLLEKLQRHQAGT